MKSIIKRYYKDFLSRGLISMGFGPLVLAIIYAILGLSGVVVSVSVPEMCIGIISITLLAFVSGGITILYRIEELPLMWSILSHGSVLYIAYTVVYIVNGWLKSGALPFIVFTLIFILDYLLVWTIIYVVMKKQTDKLNKAIEKNDK
jgi:hypothetical protein